MVTICLTFTAGRFHATPWGRHPNEGKAEWPPSPWRFLRALIAVWKLQYPELDEVLVEGLLRKLATPPSYHLPPAVHSHTRHYMPQGRPDDTLLVLDSFMALDPATPVWIQWLDAELTGHEASALHDLLRGLNYLGRAESWCQAELVTTDPPLPNATLAETPGLEAVRLLAANPMVTLAELMVESGQLQKKGRSQPPGSTFLTYFLERPKFRVSSPALSKVNPKIVRFALSSTVLPLRTSALRIAESFRKKAMGCYGRLYDGAVSAKLAGKDANGKPLHGHRHAFFLAESSTGGRFLDRITVYCPEGFDSRELAALTRVTSVWQSQGRPEVEVLFEGYDIPRASAGEAKLWVSHTPFCEARHPKKGDGAADQVLLELSRRGYPVPKVTVLEGGCPTLKERPLPTWSFQRHRERKPHPGAARAFLLEFDRAVRGPICLGYGCHFGLGLFLPYSGS